MVFPGEKYKGKLLLHPFLSCQREKSLAFGRRSSVGNTGWHCSALEQFPNWKQGASLPCMLRLWLRTPVPLVGDGFS